ncbi:potassium channel family protein [Synechococcus sp. W4D4]|uniref:potassium channel family protein n=1 Tax=Synechococcus sp. W4D4 TaxID=3392294 RepID=UPI0039E9C9C1
MTPMRQRPRSLPRGRGLFSPIRSHVAQRPWAGPILALATVVNAGAVGYRLAEGWDWGDCYWMVLITLSTLGFSDEHTQLIHTGGRIVTALLLVGGLVVVQQTIQKLLELTNSGYFRRIRQRRYREQLQRSMNQHVILCGYGRMGREIADQLIGENIRLLVVENDSDRIEEAQQRGLMVLQGDATLDETLEEAGIHRCRALVAALPSNASNLYVILSARGLAPGARLIARSDSEEAEGKLRLAGADQVVSPYVAGGRAMAATALRPLAVTFMDLLAGSDCEVDEFLLSERPDDLGDLNGASLSELQLGRRSGALVLAIRNPAASQLSTGAPEPLIANPGGDVRLGPGQLLVVMGSKQQLQRFGDLLGPALADVKNMPA